eukprot:scaffold106983_cov35-Tisochrysis_lutea.AAC.1
MFAKRDHTRCGSGIVAFGAIRNCMNAPTSGANAELPTVHDAKNPSRNRHRLVSHSVGLHLRKGDAEAPWPVQSSTLLSARAVRVEAWWRSAGSQQRDEECGTKHTEVFEHECADRLRGTECVERESGECRVEHAVRRLSRREQRLREGGHRARGGSLSNAEESLPCAPLPHSVHP